MKTSESASTASYSKIQLKERQNDLAAILLNVIHSLFSSTVRKYCHSYCFV